MPQLPIVVLAAHDSRDPDSTLRYRRSVSNIREFIEREIPVLSIVPRSDCEIEKLAPCVLRVPDVPLLLQPILEVIPLQLLAYHIAVLCGRDVDRPRHLLSQSWWNSLNQRHQPVNRFSILTVAARALAFVPRYAA